jgi:hypothetical protein
MRDAAALHMSKAAFWIRAQVQVGVEYRTAPLQIRLRPKVWQRGCSEAGFEEGSTLHRIGFLAEGVIILRSRFQRGWQPIAARRLGVLPGSIGCLKQCGDWKAVGR